MYSFIIYVGYTDTNVVNNGVYNVQLYNLFNSFNQYRFQNFVVVGK